MSAYYWLGVILRVLAAIAAVVLCGVFIGWVIEITLAAMGAPV